MEIGRAPEGVEDAFGDKVLPAVVLPGAEEGVGEAAFDVGERERRLERVSVVVRWDDAVRAFVEFALAGPPLDATTVSHGGRKW